MKRTNTALRHIAALVPGLLMIASAAATELDPNGCRVLSKLPPPGVHPRVFFTADEYPLMRERLDRPHFSDTLALSRPRKTPLSPDLR